MTVSVDYDPWAVRSYRGVVVTADDGEVKRFYTGHSAADYDAALRYARSTGQDVVKGKSVERFVEDGGVLA